MLCMLLPSQPGVISCHSATPLTCLTKEIAPSTIQRYIFFQSTVSLHYLKGERNSAYIYPAVHYQNAEIQIK